MLVNGAEGEPLSLKDRVLMTSRPHLVLDGALLAADAVGADRILLYVGEEHQPARQTLLRAVEERWPELGSRVRFVDAPRGYVSGEETAAVQVANGGPALPTMAPPRPFERGVGGRATLVQNVESLATAALIARFGADWFRSLGRGGTPGSALVTVSGAVADPGVREIDLGTTVGEVATLAGGAREAPHAVLLGGYAGTFLPAAEAWSLPLDPLAMRERGLAFGSGVVSVLPESACGVAATAEIMAVMAASSAGQCGPCVHGLTAIAAVAGRLAGGAAAPGELARLERWSTMLQGRGACKHPDGATSLLRSSLGTFHADWSAHQKHGTCLARRRRRTVA